MYDLERFTLKDMTECGAALRKLGDTARCMEDVAFRTVEHLYLHLGSGPKQTKACAVVRFFITQPYGQLSTQLQGLVHSETDVTLVSETPCLTLLASVGNKLEFCKRSSSDLNLVTALPDPTLAEQYPVVAQLVARFDLPGAFSVPYNADLFLEEPGRNFDVIYIQDASAEAALSTGVESEFVASNGIKSVIAYGGLLPSRNLFAIIIYSKTAISRQVALGFRPFPLNTKIALLPLDDEHPIFSSQVTAHGRR